MGDGFILGDIGWEADALRPHQLPIDGTHEVRPGEGGIGRGWGVVLCGVALGRHHYPSSEIHRQIDGEEIAQAKEEDQKQEKSTSTERKKTSPY